MRDSEDHGVGAGPLSSARSVQASVEQGPLALSASGNAVDRQHVYAGWKQGNYATCSTMVTSPPQIAVIATKMPKRPRDTHRLAAGTLKIGSALAITAAQTPPGST